MQALLKDYRMFLLPVCFFVFVYIHEHFAISGIKTGVFTWILLFLLTDLVWYLYYRLAHEIINSDAILDQRRWIFYLEYMRVLPVMIAIVVFYPNNRAFSGIIAVLILMIWHFRSLQRYYFKLLYTKATP